jgi:ABC-2 type transport system ATP-binding protein
MNTIEVHHLTKGFASTLAVDDLSFTVEAGTVTGFLGRNGAGKTTTLRALLGLVTPNAGSATILGRRYAELRRPQHSVGAVLDASSFHPGRRARDHLLIAATAGQIPVRRVDETLELVGLSDAATRRVGAFSLGMRQRLGLATALLGDPGVLVLDEPANGLDPDGIRWLRRLIVDLAGEGRTVLVSSHLLAEVANTVDHVVIIDRGSHVATATIAELTEGRASGVRVRTPMTGALVDALVRDGLEAVVDGPDSVVVRGRRADPHTVGRVVAAAGIVVSELRALDADLEDAFFALTGQPTDLQEMTR